MAGGPVFSQGVEFDTRANLVAAGFHGWEAQQGYLAIVKKPNHEPDRVVNLTFITPEVWPGGLAKLIAVARSDSGFNDGEVVTFNVETAIVARSGGDESTHTWKTAFGGTLKSQTQPQLTWNTGDAGINKELKVTISLTGFTPYYDSGDVGDKLLVKVTFYGDNESDMSVNTYWQFYLIWE